MSSEVDYILSEIFCKLEERDEDSCVKLKDLQEWGKNCYGIDFEVTKKWVAIKQLKKELCNAVIGIDIYLSKP